MADFVGNHIGLSEIPRCMKAILQFLIELQVDIDLAIERAIERTHGRLAGAAGRRRGAGEQHQVRLNVLFAALAELLLPDTLRGTEHLADEMRHRVIGRRLPALNFLDRGVALQVRGDVDDGSRIDAEEIAGSQGNQHGANADAAGAHRHAHAAAIFDIAAFLLVVQSHGQIPGESVERA